MKSKSKSKSSGESMEEDEEKNNESIENLVSNNVGFSKLNHYVYVSCNCVPYV
jgi:hypothetical protein